MRIGELARRTGVAPRLLRYYEQQGLISAERTDNGYRAYREADVAQVERVAGLIQAGLPTRLVRAILDLEALPCDELVATCTRDVAEKLARELATIEGRIDCLSRSRDTIRGFLGQTQYAVLTD